MSETNALLFFDRYIKGRKGEIYDYQPYISESGDLKRLEGIDAVVNQIRNLLLTPLGYYPFDPTYGSLLYQQLFEMADEGTKKTIEYECRNRIMTYISKIKITEVIVSLFTDKKGFKVDVFIDRQDVKGKVTIVLPSQQTMFGLEDIEYERTT